MLFFFTGNNRAMAEQSTVTFELTEEDIPGAVLNEPLESSTVQALKWWLQCQGIQPLSSWKKSQLIERYNY